MNKSIAALMLMCVLSACGPTPTAVPPAGTSAADIANPASTFCEANAGRLDIRTGPDGGQIGICVFPDGTECEEWAYFRGECKPGAAPSASPAAPGAPAPQPGLNVEPVALQVITPQEGAVVNSAQIQVSGTTTPQSVVTVNDQILIAGSDGTFQTTVTLDEGLNLIEVVASNPSGGETFANVTVTYQP